MLTRSLGRIKFLLLGSILLLLMGGCMDPDHKQEAKSYPRDGYMGLTYANPNVGTNPTYYYNHDEELINNTIAKIPHVKKSRVRIAGAHAYVVLLMKRNDEGTKDLPTKQEVRQYLEEQLPRDHFHVRIRRD